MWTGSQNWTDTGLCTQANSAVLLEDRKLAAEYRKQWVLLRDAKEKTPATLRDANTVPRSSAKDRRPVTLWFAPTNGQADLVDACAVVVGAKQAVLFLMFNPGPRDSLLNAIIAAARWKAVGNRLYIKGVVNQDPSTTKNPVQLFDGAQQGDRRGPVRRGARGDYGLANLGPKASGTNDENLLIMRRSGEPAAAYATNIMSVYNQYRWRFRRQVQPSARRWAGLEDGDDWQRGYLRPGSAALREVDFWAGE